MRLLVCGGRGYADRVRFYSILDELHDQNGFDTVICGGAPGADTLAIEWAHDRDLPAMVIKAEWKKLGHAAGPIRNQRMLDEGNPCLVVAFPGERGTADMVRRAHAAGVPVHEFSEGEAK
jgi:hypothetical protein